MKVVKFISQTFKDCLNSVLQAICEKEGRKGDQNMMDLLMRQQGNEIKLLSFRILDELIKKEAAIHPQNTSIDFSKMYMKEIFLKGVFVCAAETIFYINV